MITNDGMSLNVFVFYQQKRLLTCTIFQTRMTVNLTLKFTHIKTPFGILL